MKSFQNILAVVNVDSPEKAVTEKTAELAARNGGKLKLVDAIRDFGWLRMVATPSRSAEETARRNARRDQLDALAKQLQQKYDIPIETHVLPGRSSVEIIREVASGGHDLVAMDAADENGTHGFFCGTGVQLMRSCPCPVWMVKAGPHEHHRRVIAAVDADCTDQQHEELNQRILELAVSFCQQEGARLEVVHAWNLYGENTPISHLHNQAYQNIAKECQQKTKEVLDGVLAPFGLNHESDNVYILHGTPIDAITRFAEERETDMIVLGTVGRSGLKDVLVGNTAEEILGTVGCSVMTVKPSKFVSPVVCG